MAIWPFGRKGKRPRSQMKASDAADRRLSFDTPRDISMSAERTPVARKPSRKRSKRGKHRSAPVLQDQSSRAAPTAPGVAQAGAGGQTGSSFSYALDNHTSLSSIGQDHFTVSAIPTLQKRDSAAGKGNTLKKRLSKRSALELQREREIKALSSSPPSGCPRLANTWGYQSSDVRRGTSVHSRNHADNRTSNQSLPLGSQSSSSDLSDLYTYKVNAFAVFAPRPIIRYSENPNKHLPPRSTNPSANSMRRDMFQGDEDDWQSHKRIAELADEMDAAALRELMERDRRRREKKALEEQERRKRRLQRRLDREQQQLQLQQQQQVEISKHQEAGVANEDLAIIDDDDHDLRGRDKTPSPATSSRPQQPETIVDKKYETGGDYEDENAYAYSHDQSGSWLREPSNSSRQRYSDISAHVIGNIDDRSLHAGQADQVDRGINATSDEDISKHRSPLFQAVGSSSSAHMSSIAQESISDLSRTGNSEKRFSDTSSRRMSSWISFFRRGSLRKRKSKEIDAPSSDFSNTSRDSFMKIHSHSTGPSMPVPILERHYRRAGTVYRTQSKFVEHLDNYPISPPHSRMQSPVPVPLETVSDVPAGDDVESVGPSSRQSFTAGDGYNYTNDEGHSRPMSWDENSGAFSQSLASIDSEGSWMSGNFLRRISQKNPNFTSWRNSNGMNKLDKYKVAEENEDEVTSDESLNQLADQPSEQGLDPIADMRRPSSSAIGLDMADGEGGSEDSARSSNEILDASGIETWHQGIERKPTVVRRDIDRRRKMSNEVVLGDIATLDTDAASMLDNDLESPLGPASPDAEINRATSIDYGRNHKHVRQISAGSAKLLDIVPRPSVDSSRQ